MIFDPGTKIVFTARNGEQRATQLCEEFPDATVKIGPRSVRLIDPARLVIMVKPKPKAAAALLFLLCTFVSPAPGIAGGLGEPPPVASLSKMILAGIHDAPAAILAEASGGFSNAEMGSWIMILFAIASGIGAVAGVIALFRPQPALHKQFADREQTHEDLREVKSSLRELTTQLQAWSSDHYDARRRMHARINILENALSFMAGKLARANDPDAARLESLLRRAENIGGDES